MIKTHTHRFKVRGMTIYCECGMTSKIDCAHVWDKGSVKNVSFLDKSSGREIGQEVQSMICTKCGAMGFRNLTTGEMRITH